MGELLEQNEEGVPLFTQTEELPAEAKEELPVEETEELPVEETEELSAEETKEQPAVETEELPAEETMEVIAVETVVPEEPTLQPEPGVPLWATAVVAAIAVAALIAVFVQGRLLRRLKRRNAAAASASSRRGIGSISVGKLHAQGARNGQQDSFGVSDEALMNSYGLLVAVADGMGGLTDGDKVSAAAVEAVLDSFTLCQGDRTPQELLLELAHQAVLSVNNLLGPDNYRKSGSTLVMGLIRNGYFTFLSIGDSRVCLYRDGCLTQLNREHTYTAELALQAVNDELTVQEALSHPKGSGLVSFLGMGRLKALDLPAAPVELRAGDLLILMSDGVYNALEPYEIAGALEDAAPEEAVERLRAAIQDKNYSNQDNYTAVVIGCGVR